MNLNYNTDIPFASHNPSVDQPLMQTNTNSTNTWVAVDHHGFQDNLGGYHTIIHQDSDGGARTQVTDPIAPFGFIRTGFPVAIPGINQFFSADVTPLTSPVSGADTQLFSMTGAGGISQLTGNAAAQEGYQWIGGNLVQWGKVTSVLQDQDTAFVGFQSRNPGVTISFPTNIWSVTATLYINSVGGGSLGVPTFPGTIVIDDSNVTRTGFKWWFIGPPGAGASRYQGFYWVAVGN